MGRIASALLTFLMACSLCGQDAAPATHLASGSLKVHFIDVGQADAILVQTPSGRNMLVDAGNNDDASIVKSYMKAHGVGKLDAVVGTHPHEDHIGALDKVVKAFPVSSVYLPKVSAETKTFEDLLKAIAAKGLKKAVSVNQSSACQLVVSFVDLSDTLRLADYNSFSA